MQFCDDCGREAAVDEERAAAFVSTEHQRNADVIEADPEADVEGRPTTTDVHCDECGTERAYYEIMQTASADEPPTRFFKCKDCGSVWRAYD